MAASRVVVVGGGFGGLNAVRGLSGAPVQVTLIDKRNCHLFRPMLYQVASGLLSPEEIAVPLRGVLSKQRNAEVLMDEVVGVDTANRLVRLNNRDIPYDFLILSTGIHYNYFGHDEWREIATPLEALEEADIIRTKVLTALERAENLAAAGNASADEIRRQLTSAIQEGEYVARLIRSRVTNRPAPPPFWYWDKGDLAIVGRTYAVADLRFVRFAGFPAWLTWVAVHIYFLIGFANRLFVLLQWAVFTDANLKTVRPTHRAAVSPDEWGALAGPTPRPRSNATTNSHFSRKSPTRIKACPSRHIGRDYVGDRTRVHWR